MSEEEIQATIWLTNILTKSEKDKQNIQTLLNLVDRLLKENRHLKEQLLISNNLDNMYDLYISKDKIRDKIKELEEELSNEMFENEVRAKIEILQELLEEE